MLNWTVKSRVSLPLYSSRNQSSPDCPTLPLSKNSTVVGAAADFPCAHLVARPGRQFNRLRQLGCVVWLAFENGAEAALLTHIDIYRRERTVMVTAVPDGQGVLRGKAKSSGRMALLARARPHCPDRLFINNRSELQRVLAWHRSAVDEIDVAVERVQHLSPAGRSNARRRLPGHGYPGIGWQSRLRCNADGDLDCFPGLQFPGGLPGAREPNYLCAGRPAAGVFIETPEEQPAAPNAARAKTCWQRRHGPRVSAWRWIPGSRSGRRDSRQCRVDRPRGVVGNIKIQASAR